MSNGHHSVSAKCTAYKTSNGFFITEETLKGIITDAIELAISNFMTMIKQEINSQTKNAIETLEGKTHDLGVQAENNNTTLAEVNKKCDTNEQNSLTAIQIATNVQTSDQTRAKEMQAMRDNMNTLEQYTRRSNIRIYGMYENQHETIC